MTGEDLTPQEATGELIGLCKEPPPEWTIAERLVRVRQLLDAGADVKHATTARKMTPLLYAAQRGDEAICALLMDAGADVTDKDVDSRTPLYFAASKGRLAVCKLLLDKSAEVDARNQDEATPLHGAAHEGHDDVCALLIANGADIDARDNQGATPLLKSMLGISQSVWGLLIAHQANVNIAYANGNTPLGCAVFQKNEPLCRMLIAHGAEVNCIYADKTTPLHIAANRLSRGICKLLVDNGADVNAEDSQGDIPLQKAVYNCDRDVSRILLQAGSNVDERKFTAGEKEWLQHFIAAIAVETRQYFASDTFYHTPVRKKYFAGDDTLNPRVLDACITDQFYTRIALPLMNSKDGDSLILCRKVFDALPNLMKTRNNQTAVLLSKYEGRQEDGFLLGNKPRLHTAQEETRRKKSDENKQGLSA